nr:voltage-gated hydrogen channel 1 [Quercus suber]
MLLLDVNVAEPLEYLMLSDRDTHRSRRSIKRSRSHRITSSRRETDDLCNVCFGHFPRRLIAAGTGTERTRMSGPEHQPLLTGDIAPLQSTAVTRTRHKTKTFLSSKYGHYTVLGLVSLDVSSIFAELLIQLLTCEGRIAGASGQAAGEALSIISLVFSSLFMLELLASVWAFGWVYVRAQLLPIVSLMTSQQAVCASSHMRFFKSTFHVFDATVISTSFVLDIVLKVINEDALEEISSLIIVLRLWRVFKIIEELSAGAEEQIEPLQEKIEDLEKQNEELRETVQSLAESLQGS